ncbi:hypothetical protein AWB77_06724 [Caballeronia fortuita]|uniref:Uncharacterized protein n=1 Tax=Caballeronia fortuita TaxID=1777138 RepID=A0A158E8F3_9BURK|nr:hypothetical protein AWB77_06724 [Caballeronia fortuita]
MLAPLLLAAWLICFPITWTWRWHWRIAGSARLICPQRCVGRKVLTCCRSLPSRYAYWHGYAAGMTDAAPTIPYRRSRMLGHTWEAWTAGWWAGSEGLTLRGVAWYARMCYPQPSHDGGADA